jgi:hypothetical protein
MKLSHVPARSSWMIAVFPAARHFSLSFGRVRRERFVHAARAGSAAAEDTCMSGKNLFAVPERLRRLQIEITTGCNLRCAGCQRTLGMAKAPGATRICRPNASPLCSAMPRRPR